MQRKAEAEGKKVLKVMLHISSWQQTQLTLLIEASKKLESVFSEVNDKLNRKEGEKFDKDKHVLMLVDDTLKLTKEQENLSKYFGIDPRIVDSQMRIHNLQGSSIMIRQKIFKDKPEEK